MAEVLPIVGRALAGVAAAAPVTGVVRAVGGVGGQARRTGPLRIWLMASSIFSAIRAWASIIPQPGVTVSNTASRLTGCDILESMCDNGFDSATVGTYLVWTGARHRSNRELLRA